MIKEFDFLFKLVIAGNQGAGKSCLFLRFSDDMFVDHYLATIGVDFRFKTLQVDGHLCKLQIWDTAGQQRFRTITSAYYKGSNAVLLIYDTNAPQTLQELESYWVNQVKANADKDIQIVLVGTKIDLERRVSQDAVASLAESLGVSAFEVSAKTGEGVAGMFEQICRKLIEKSSVKKAVNNAAKLQGKQEKKSGGGGCC